MLIIATTVPHAGFVARMTNSAYHRPHNDIASPHPEGRSMGASNPL